MGPSADSTSETTALSQLMDAGRRLVSELDPDIVASLIVTEARAITGARQASLARAWEEVESSTPGPGVLAVALRARGRTWGTLRLSEKENGEEFSEADEAGVRVLADFAATALENARLYEEAETGRQQLVRAVRGLEAARTISDAIGAEVELEAILQLIVKRGRALVGARSVMILLTEGEELVVVAGIGATGDRRGTRVPIAGTFSGKVLTSGVAGRLDRVPDDLPPIRDRLGLSDVRTALVVPLIHRSEGIGVLIATDRGAEQGPFTDSDEELMATFASSAANAVSISHSVEADRLRVTIASAEDERRRWARELHDQTLQALGGLRVLLSGARRHDELGGFRESVDQAIADLEWEIQNLRGIIADLRPPLLDDLGIADALTALISRQREAGLDAHLSLQLDRLEARELSLSADLETAVYRLIQEALTNVVKHARARSVHVRLSVSETDRLVLEVVDDGVGFDTSQPSSGFGLGSIRERVYLAGGTLSFDSGPQGTALSAEMPLAPARPEPA